MTEAHPFTPPLRRRGYFHTAGNGLSSLANALLPKPGVYVYSEPGPVKLTREARARTNACGEVPKNPKHAALWKYIDTKVPAKLRDRAKALRCLSVKDPWITRIGRGVKPYEIRKKRTKYRGSIILCSSGKRSRERGADDYMSDDGPKGFALYVAELVDCYPATDKHTKGASVKPLKGEWVWELRNVRPIKHTAVIGSLGLYYPTKDVLAAALEVIR